MSWLAMINASVIQGSVIGPPSFIVAASDLHPINGFNVLLKYADDSYLLIGSRNISTAAAEFANISKTRELIVFRSARLRPDVPSHPIISGAERVSSLRVLGVVISSELGMS